MNPLTKLLVGILFISLIANANAIPEPMCPGDMSGTGISEDPCVVTTCEELQSINEELDLDYMLGNDIDCSETFEWGCDSPCTGFVPLGSMVWRGVPFTGSFDGQGHTISNLYIYRPNQNHIGLFGGTVNSEIYDLVLENVNITGWTRVGALIGNNNGGIVYNVNVKGGTVNGSSIGPIGGTGGLIGVSRYAGADPSIMFCKSSADVYGTIGVGGLVGVNRDTIVACSASGDVVGIEESLCAGGLVGLNGANIFTEEPIPQFTGFVLGSSASGDVSGFYGVGGLVGCSYPDEYELYGDLESSETLSVLEEVSSDTLPNEILLESHGSTIPTAYEGLSDYLDFGALKEMGVSASEDEFSALVAGFPMSIVAASYATGDVEGVFEVGGAIGDDYSLTFRSYATGDVYGIEDVGGFSGWNTFLDLQVFATGSVTGEMAVGGLVGLNDGGFEGSPGVFFAAYNNHAGNPSDCIGDGIEGLCFDIEDNESWFWDVVDTSAIYGGWNFENVWDTIYDDYDYPPLVWQDAPPATNNFGGTDFSEVEDIEAVENMILTSGNGSISWSGTVNASEQNFDKYITIGPGFVSIDTDALDGSISGEATITLNGVTCPVVPYYANGTFGTVGGVVAAGKVCDSTTDPKCTNVACMGGMLVFTVSHFSSFAAAKAPSRDTYGETTYHLFDETEGQETMEADVKPVEPADGAPEGTPETAPETPEDVPGIEEAAPDDVITPIMDEPQDLGMLYILIALVVVVLALVLAVKKGIIELPEK